MKESNNNSRRDFLKKTGIFLGASITFIPLASMLNSCEKDQTILTPAPPPPPTGGMPLDLTPFPDLATEGNTLMVNFTYSGTKYTFFIKRVKVSTSESTDDFIVLDTKCTHQGAVLDKPGTPDGNFICPEHGAHFYSTADNQGQIASNPNGVSPLTDLNWYGNKYKPTENKLYIGKIKIKGN